MATPAGRSRRRFLSTVGLATTAFTIVPRHVLGRGFQAPSDRLNIAVVGVGGRGRAVITNMVGENLVAMCDVDWGYADQGFADLETDISKLEERIAANVVEVRAPASARNEGAPPAVTTRPMTPLERSRAIGWPAASGRSPAWRRRPLATRTSAGCSTSRRTSTRWSWPHPITCTRPSRWPRWTSASTSTSRSRCAGRSPRPGSSPSVPPRRRSRRRWAIRATRPTMGVWSWSTSRPAPLAR